MHYRYAIAEGALYRPIKWKETTGGEREFPNETALFQHAEQGAWELVTILASGNTGNYRQFYFKRSQA